MARAASAQSLSCSQCSPPPAAMLSACHGRKKRDFTGTFDRGIGLHMPLINRGSDYFRVCESVGILFATRGKPRHQVGDSGNARWNLDNFLRLADTFAYPGKITQFHTHSSII